MSKKGFSRNPPLNRARRRVRMNQSTRPAPPKGSGFGSPRAPPVKTQNRTGPNDLSTLADPSRQARARPTKGSRLVAGVLPIGVMQQAAYQRSRPVSERRTHAR